MVISSSNLSLGALFPYYTNYLSIRYVSIRCSKFLGREVLVFEEGFELLFGILSSLGTEKGRDCRI